MNENNNESKTFPAPALTADITPAPYPISALSFRFAKTMKDAPHEYVIRSQENAEAYTELFKLIGENAVPEEWRGRTYGYWYAGDGWKYWRLEGYPWIINRARAAQ
jgi:hypothetical protein